MVVSKHGHRLEIKLAECFDPPPGSSTEIFPLTSTEHHNSFSNRTYRLSTKMYYDYCIYPNKSCGAYLIFLQLTCGTFLKAALI